MQLSSVQAIKALTWFSSSSTETHFALYVCTTTNKTTHNNRLEELKD
jgi:hypothetical protein